MFLPKNSQGELASQSTMKCCTNFDFKELIFRFIIDTLQKLYKYEESYLY